MAAHESGHQIRYSVYDQSDADDMVRLLGEVFVQHDPPNIAVGLLPSEFEAFVRLLCGRAEIQPLTIIARSGETGEMAGALLAEDSALGPPQGIDQLSVKFHPILDLLSQLNAAHSGSAVSTGESLHLFLLGVSNKFAGQGVAHQLVAECLANGVRNGYRKAVTEATNRTSQHIFRKQGFEECGRLSYRDYRFHGQAVFASIAEHGGPMLMEKLLKCRGSAR